MCIFVCKLVCQLMQSIQFLRGMFIVFSIKENILQLLTLEEVPEGDYVYIAFKLLLIGYSVPTEKLASITTVGKLSIHSVASSKVSSPQSAI